MLRSSPKPARLGRALNGCLALVILLLPGSNLSAQERRWTVAKGVPILIYHEIAADEKEPGETTISLSRFKEQMQLLADEGYTTLSIRELIQFMRGERAVRPRSVVLTFDDGWRSVLQAVPVLNQHRFKASFWIIAGPKGIGGEYLDWPQIAALAQDANFEIGSHTLSHPWDPKDNLVTWVEGRGSERGVSDAFLELQESREILEARLGRPVRYLAWPCGWYNDTLIRLAQEAGYEALLTVEPGVNVPGADLLRIRRNFIDGACDMTVFKQVLQWPHYHVCQTRRLPSRGILTR